MNTLTPDQLLAQLRWRYAVKKFDPAKKVEPALWQQLEQVLQLSPSSYGLQPWLFVVVTDPAVRAKLKDAAWGQAQITDASHLVVFCVKKGMGPADAERLISHSAKTRGVPADTLAGYQQMINGSFAKFGPEEVDEWMTRQVYISLGMFLGSAAVLGVDACPMEGFDPAKFDEILGLTAKGYGSRVLATVGYRAADDPYVQLAKVRYPLEELLLHV